MIVRRWLMGTRTSLVIRCKGLSLDWACATRVLISGKREPLRCDLFRAMNCHVVEGPPQAAEGHIVHRCSQCDSSFETAAGLAVHESKAHGKRVAARRYAMDGHCRVCRKFFHTRARLIQHLHYSQTDCWWKTMRWLEPCSEATAQQLDHDARQQGHAWHQHGHHSHLKDRIWRWSREEELTPSLPQRCELDDIDDSEPTADELREWAAIGGGRTPTTRKSSPWTVWNAVTDASQREQDMLQTVKLWRPDEDWIPAPVTENARYVLILFSGHRRVGDLATWMQWEGVVHPVCIDTALDPHFGNLYRTGYWQRMIEAGVVVGLHAGPPCETYTMARWLEVLERSPEGELQRRGPRPLRDAAFPWGLPRRSLQETFQMLNGTLLMFRTLQWL